MVTLVGQEAEEFDCKDIGGCKWKRGRMHTLSPSPKWSGCKAEEGKRLVKLQGATNWPLKVESKYK